MVFTYLILHGSPKCTWISRIDGCNDVKQYTAPGRDRLILTGVRLRAEVRACVVSEWKNYRAGGKALGGMRSIL